MARPPKSEQQKTMLKTLGQNVRAAREHAGVSQIAVSESVGAAHADYIRSIEQGVTDPSATRLIQIAVALNVDPSALVAGMAAQADVELAK